MVTPSKLKDNKSGDNDEYPLSIILFIFLHPATAN